MTYFKTAIISGFMAIFLSLLSPTLAQMVTAVSSHRLLHCQTSLKKVCVRLEQFAKNRQNQYYYSSLYQQSQDFLKKLNSLPITSPETPEILGQCDNFLATIHDILGRHHTEMVLAPMPDTLPLPSGTLTAGAHDVKSRTLRTNRPIRYILASEDTMGIKQIEDEENLPEREPLPTQTSKMKMKSSLEEFE